MTDDSARQPPEAILWEYNKHVPLIIEPYPSEKKFHAENAYGRDYVLLC